MAENYDRHPNTNCTICHKPIYKRPSIININEGKVYCSQRCYGISCRKEIPCLICKKPILSGLNKKTCSRICANKLKIGIRYTGKRLRDRVVSYLSLKKRLIKTKGKKCQICGYNRYEILQIHHIDKNRNNNNLNNLELLCPNCHSEKHHTIINKLTK